MPPSSSASPATSASARRPEAGALIAGRFRLRGEIGRGSMGEVWLAEHAQLGSPVAVKFLRADAQRDPWIAARFLEEARIAASLQTRHVVRVLDFGATEGGVPFVVMEYLDGETLEARRKRHRRLAPDVAARLLGDAARALARAHSMGIVHRDFKPANLILATDEDGFVTPKVIDFGVAKRVSVGEMRAAANAHANAEGGDDGTDDRMPGTLVYMAPEQLGARECSAASDQWAFGVVAYECLTGKLPFARKAIDAFRADVQAGIFEAPSRVNPALPKALDTWMSTVLAVDPARRFPNMIVCADALREALGASDSPRVLMRRAPRVKHRHARAILGVVAVAAPALALALAWVGSARVLEKHDADAPAHVPDARGVSDVNMHPTMMTCVADGDARAAHASAARVDVGTHEPAENAGCAGRARDLATTSSPASISPSRRVSRARGLAYRGDPY